MRPFSFDLSARRNHFTADEILDGLRAFAASTQARILTAEDFDHWPARPFNAKVAATRFGSWRHALKAAGLRVGRPWQYSAEHLINALEETWRALGRPPGKNALYRRTGLTDTPFRDRWGSIPFACEALAQYHKGEITRDQLLNPPKPTFPNRRTPLSPSVRYKIMKRDSFRCTCCGASPRDPRATDPRATDSPALGLVGAPSPSSSDNVVLEVDHILPISRGGSNDESNLRTLCRTCNQGKRNDP